MDYYEPHDVTGDGRPETFCNVYVSDVLYLLGIKLPRTQEKCPAGNPIMPDDRYMPLMANQLNAYFNDGGGGHWTEVNRQKAVSLANKGNVVVVSMVEAGHGHIALVIPGGKGDKVHIAQAGQRLQQRYALRRGIWPKCRRAIFSIPGLNRQGGQTCGREHHLMKRCFTERQK